MRNDTSIAIAVIVAALLSGCGNEGLFEHELTFGPPVELSSGIAVTELGTRQVFLFEARSDGARVRRLFAAEDGTDIAWMRPGSEHGDSLFLLTAPVSERDTGTGVILTRIHADTEEVVHYPVGTPFDGSAFDPQGRFLVLYHGSEAAPEALYNPNEVALVDIDAPAGEGNPVTMSVEFGGRAIEDVRYIPTLDVDGRERRLAAFLARGSIKLVDLLEPGIGGISIKLSPDGGAGGIMARQIIARPGDGERDPALFVRASGTNDIYAVSLVPRTDGEPGFWAALNMFDGQAPRDMALVEDGGRLLLVVATGNRVLVIDVDTADSFSLTLDGSANHVLPREGEVVLHGAGTYRIHFLAAAGLAAAKGSNLSTIHVPDGIGWAMPLRGDRMLLDTYGGDMLVLDLATRALTRLAGAGYVDWALAEIHDDRFFLGEPGSDRVITMDLATGHPAPLVLDEPVQSFHLVPGWGMGLVMHARATGRATIFPLTEPTRERAFMVDGFWIEGFLDDTEVQP